MKKVTLSTIFSLLIIFSMVSTTFAATTDLPASGWWSSEIIQNVDSLQAQLSIVAYNSATNDTYTISNELLNPGESKTYSPQNFPSLPADFKGSAIVSSSRPVRAVVNVTNRYNAAQGFGDSLATSPAAGQYQGVIVPALTVNFPLVKNNYFSKTTIFAIQNAGDMAATATATFKLPTSNAAGAPIGTYTYTTPSIPVGDMVIVRPEDARDGGNNPPPSGNYIIGAVTVTSSEELAGTAMEYLVGEVHASQLHTSRGYTADDYDDLWYAPINKRSYFSRFTGLLIQNVSAAAIDVNVNYVGSQGACAGVAYGPQSKTGLGAGESWLAPSSFLPDNCLASAQVQGTGNIVVVVNEGFVAGVTNSAGKNEVTTYNAFPDKVKTAIVSAPLYKEHSYAKQSSLIIQNVGAATATNVIITFKGPTGTYISAAQTINAGAALTILAARLKPVSFWNGTAMTSAALGCSEATVTGCGLNGVFGVIVTSDQPIVVIVQESTYPNNAPLINQDKNNYEGFNLTAAP